MKKLFVTLALILVLVFALAACNGGNTPGGENAGDEAHIFRTEWTSDDEKHWQSCLDLSCDARKNEAYHTFGEWVIDEEATCMKAGTKHRTCVVCGKSVSETIPIEPDAHNYATSWTSDGAHHWHKCQNSGCTSVSDKSEHTWNNENTCVCQKYKDDGVNFTLQSDGTYAVLGYTGSASEVIIPSTYNGIPVTSIGSFAFYGCTGLTSITIPDSVTSIDYRAFYGCTSLTSITFGENSQLKNIGVYAFSDTGYYNNESNWENGVLYIGKHLIETKTSLSGSYAIKEGTLCIAAMAFYDWTSLTSITIPDSVTSIGSSAFYGCSSLTSITIPEGVTTIGNSAFSGCTSLTSITIPDSVTSIGSSAFQNCSRLANITIPEGVTSIGEYAFYMCGLTSITIPDSVKSIGWNAFSYCTSLTSVTFGENSQLTSIGSYTFSNCSRITSITIPRSVTSIGNSVFHNCSKLTSITFGGTKAEWNNITKEAWWNDNTPSITVYCTNGTVTETSID